MRPLQARRCSRRNTPRGLGVGVGKSMRFDAAGAPVDKA